MKLSPIFAILLAGCAYVSPGSLIALSRLDPLTSDPARIAVRADLPQGLDLTPGSVTLSVSASRDTGDDTLDHTWVLVRQGPIWRMTDADAAHMRRVQQQVSAWEGSTGASGSISVGAQPCTIGAGPLPGATFDLLLRTDPDAAFAPMLRNVPVARIDPQDLQPCQPAPRPR